MRIIGTLIFTAAASLLTTATSYGAPRPQWHQTTETETWAPKKIRLAAKPDAPVVMKAADSDQGTTFKHLGTTFNELDWDAFLSLSRNDQDELMRRMFAHDGDLRLTRGRISMNCNDYGRSWYSCDEVAGDLELRHFNIERDKRSIIPLIRAAQKYNPGLTFWTSPWSPPSWMKINHDYPVVSSRYNAADPRVDYLLFGSTDEIDEDEMKLLGERDGKFPRRLATQDYFIQDPRYLQAYADYFCKFIDAYREQGVPIDMVMYQNEAYSYTPYPGCAWTAEGTVRFNRDYLAPTLAKHHPEVDLYLGTFNTNRQDYVEKILSDGKLTDAIGGIGFQWEGREILPEIRRQHPQLSYICSESECGNGDMDWKAGEHTFFILADNLGNGCDEWYNWNFLLPKKGTSPWGWNQNALVELDPDSRTIRYTPEYQAVKHFAQALEPGSRIVAYTGRDEKGITGIMARDKAGRYSVVIANREDTPRPISVEVNGRYINATLDPHSFNTFSL